jgi:hypothetical protein
VRPLTGEAAGYVGAPGQRPGVETRGGPGLGRLGA